MNKENQFLLIMIITLFILIITSFVAMVIDCKRYSEYIKKSNNDIEEITKGVRK